MTGLLLKFNGFFFIVLFMMPLTFLHAAEDPDELYREGRFSEAEKAYKKADMDNPRDIRFRYNRGCAAYQKSDFKGAAASFTSVLRRAKSKDMLYRSSFNLGNIAFTQNDFTSAIEYYKRAIVHKPDSSDAKYNLELALKKQAEAKDKKDQDKDGKQCKDGKDKEQQKESGQKDRSKDNNNKNKDQENENRENREQARNTGDEENKKEDLSGELSADNQPQDEIPDENAQSVSAALLDKKKAEALLDNIKEDRAKIMQNQVPNDKKGNVGSGKAW